MNVTLWKLSESKDSLYRQVVPDGRHFQQFNQIFRLVSLTTADEGSYQCRAENMSTPLDVLVVHIPHRQHGKNIGILPPNTRTCY